MFEIHVMLRDSAEAFALAGGAGYIIRMFLYALDIWYLMHLFRIPFYIRDIAKNTGRGR